jgi:hypothetical protein
MRSLTLFLNFDERIRATVRQISADVCWFPPLLGERVGVRVVVPSSNFSATPSILSNVLRRCALLGGGENEFVVKGGAKPQYSGIVVSKSVFNFLLTDDVGFYP